MPKLAERPLEIGDAPSLAPDLRGYRCELVEQPGPAWDQQASFFADMCLEQTAAFAGTRFGAARSLGFIMRRAEGSDPVAMALAVVAKLPVVGLGLAYIKFGPLWRRNAVPADPTVLSLALEFLKQELAIKRGLLLRILPPADPEYAEQWRDALAKAGFAFSAALPEPERYLVNLTLAEEEQLASLGSKWRANLNKVTPGQLDIQEVDLKTGLPVFLSLYQKMVARKHFDDRHGIEDLQRIADVAGEALGIRLFIASHGGEPVVGSIIIGSGERLAVPFSATDDKALELRAGYAVRWEIVKRLRGTRARWLDLGGAEGDQGLRHYKLGNVGKRGVVVSIPGEFDFSPNGLASSAAKAIMLGREFTKLGAMKRLIALLPL